MKITKVERPLQPAAQFKRDKKQAYIDQYGEEDSKLMWRNLADMWSKLPAKEKNGYKLKYEDDCKAYEQYQKNQSKSSTPSKKQNSGPKVPVTAQELPLQPLIPTARIRKVSVLNDEPGKARKQTAECVALMTKSTELFIGWLAQRTVEVVEAHKKTMVSTPHFLRALQTREALVFLGATMSAAPEEDDENFVKSSPKSKDTKSKKKDKKKSKKTDKEGKKRKKGDQGTDAPKAKQVKTSHRVIPFMGEDNDEAKKVKPAHPHIHSDDDEPKKVKLHQDTKYELIGDSGDEALAPIS